MNTIRKKISELTSKEIEQISSFLESNFCTVFHEPDFNGIVSETFNSQFSYNLVYNDDGGLIALCPLHSIRDSFLINTYSNPAIYDIPYGGFVFDNSKTCEEELINIIRPAFNESINYFSNPFNFSQIKNGQSYLKRETAFIDLTSSEEDIWMNNINGKRRNMIRKAQKSDETTTIYTPRPPNIIKKVDARSQMERIRGRRAISAQQPKLESLKESL